MNKALKSGSTAVGIVNVNKSFGAFRVLSDCSLAVEPGSFVTLLGASGSGKTTLLRIIAGFIRPDDGEITFNGRPTGGMPAHKRNIGMVFQSYALFPHLSVFDNVAYPLRMRGLKQGARERVTRTLEAVRLDAFAQRMPAALSGGQRQRVAMARALVANPPLLLLDEPLSALDKELREQLQVELKTIHRQAGATFISVTHDQSEALGMSDVVVVMGNGRIQQAAHPRELWEKPANAFVARFLGGSNLIPATAEGEAYRIGDGSALIAREGPARGAVELAFRPESVVLRAKATGKPGWNVLPGSVVETIFLGEAVRVVVRAAGREILVRIPNAQAVDIQPGASVFLEWSAEATLALGTEAAA